MAPRNQQILRIRLDRLIQEIENGNYLNAENKNLKNTNAFVDLKIIMRSQTGAMLDWV